MGLNNSDKESLVINWSKIKSINGLNKGRTTRKVMGGGGEGNFRAAGIFFRYQIPGMNFF